MRLKIGQNTVLTVIAFYGAGWSWPHCHYGKWYWSIYFHCKRGLHLSIGWSESDRQRRKKWRELSPEHRAEIREAIRQALDEPR